MPPKDLSSFRESPPSTFTSEYLCGKFVVLLGIGLLLRLFRCGLFSGVLLLSLKLDLFFGCLSGLISVEED